MSDRDDINQAIDNLNEMNNLHMEERIRELKTFDEFFAWLESPETDVKNGKSEELALKQAFRRSSIEITRRNVEGDTLEARNKAMEKIGYKQRMQWVYEEMKH